VAAKIADAAGDAAAKFTRGCLRDDRQRAAFGVAAEQGALRTLENFDTLDIEQRGVEAMLTAEIDAVDVDADALFARRLVGVERHDAADADGQRRLAGFKGGNAQRGNAAVGEIEQALHLALGNHFSAHHRDRDRGALQIGFALGRGNHDFGEAMVFGRGASFGWCIGSRGRLGSIGGRGELREGKRGDGS